MNIKACDVCYYTNKKLVQSKYRVGYTGTPKLDICEEHKDWTKQFKGKQEFVKGVFKLMDS